MCVCMYVCLGGGDASCYSYSSVCEEMDYNVLNGVLR